MFQSFALDTVRIRQTNKQKTITTTYKKCLGLSLNQKIAFISMYEVIEIVQASYFAHLSFQHARKAFLSSSPIFPHLFPRN